MLLSSLLLEVWEVQILLHPEYNQINTCVHKNADYVQLYKNHKEVLQRYSILQKLLIEILIEDQKDKYQNTQDNLLQKYKTSQVFLRTHISKAITNLYEKINNVQCYITIKDQFMRLCKSTSNFLKIFEETIFHFEKNCSQGYMCLYDYCVSQWKYRLPIKTLDLLCVDVVSQIETNIQENELFLLDLNDEQYRLYFKEKFITKIKLNWLDLWNKNTSKSLLSLLDFISKFFQYCKETTIFTYCIKTETRIEIEEWFYTLFIKNEKIKSSYFLEFIDFLDNTEISTIKKRTYFCILYRYFRKEEEFSLILQQWNKWILQKYVSTNKPIQDIYHLFVNGTQYIQEIFNSTYVFKMELYDIIKEKCSTYKINNKEINDYILKNIVSTIFSYWNIQEETKIHYLITFLECSTNKIQFLESFENFLKDFLLDVCSMNIDKIIQCKQNIHKIINFIEQCEKSDIWFYCNTKWGKMLMDIRLSEDMMEKYYESDMYMFIGTSSFYITDLSSLYCKPIENIKSLNYHPWFTKRIEAIQDLYNLHYTNRKLYLMENKGSVTLQWGNSEIMCPFSVANILLHIQDKWDKSHNQSCILENTKTDSYLTILRTCENHKLLHVKEVMNNLFEITEYEDTDYVYPPKIVISLKEILKPTKKKENKHQLLFQKNEYIKLKVIKTVKSTENCTYKNLIEILQNRDKFPLFTPETKQIHDVCMGLKEHEYIHFQEPLENSTQVTLFED